MSTTTPPALAAPMPPVPTTMAGAPGGPRIAENRWEWLDAIEMFNQTSPVALKPAAQLIACSLSRRAMDVQEAWTSQARLAAVTGMSRRTVQRAMAELEAAGFLVLVRRASQHRAPRYALTIPALGEAGADNVRGDATAPPAPVDNPTQERHGDAPAHPRDNMVPPLEPPGTTPSRARGVATPPDQRMIKHSPYPPQPGRTDARALRRLRDGRGRARQPPPAAARRSLRRQPRRPKRRDPPARRRGYAEARPLPGTTLPSTPCCTTPPPAGSVPTCPDWSSRSPPPAGAPTTFAASWMPSLRTPPASSCVHCATPPSHRPRPRRRRGRADTGDGAASTTASAPPPASAAPAAPRRWPLPLHQH